MGSEIERKFLVVGEAWKSNAVPVLIRQGYLSSAPDRIVRVRTAGEAAYLTIKGRTTGIARVEFEYPIPAADAADMLRLMAEQPILEKRRYTVPYAGHVWEVDEFLGANAGLVVAEVELSSADETVDVPSWAGAEVSHDPRYFNSNLVRTPYTVWSI